MKSTARHTCTMAALLLVASAVSASAFTCKISADKKTVALIGSNTQARDTSCTVHCDIRTSTGSTAILECTREVPANAKDHELCSKTSDNGALYERLVNQSGSCVDQSAVKDSGNDDDMAKIPDADQLKKQLGTDIPPSVKKMLDQMKKE